MELIMMSGIELTIVVAVFGLTIWLGAYLLGRDISNIRLRLAGSGLIIYAFGLGCLILSGDPGNPSPLCQALLISPAILWTGALIMMLPDNHRWRGRFYRLWLIGQIPVVLLIFYWTWFLSNAGGTDVDPTPYLLVMAILVPLFAMIVILTQEAIGGEPRKALGLLIFGVIIFSFSTLSFLIPLQIVSVPVLILGMGLDLLVLGLAVTRFDAFDQGEAFVKDILRSFSAALIYASIFASLVILTAAAGLGMSFWMTLLLLSVIVVAILSQTLAGLLSAWLDQLVFANSPDIEQERAELRGVAEAAPRLDTRLKPEKLDVEEMVRLTRKAISHYGNLPRLASSPLVQLTLIDNRLLEKGRQPNTLERATELKELLTEAIMHLKPRSDAQFGETDEWRFFNALYYPYIAGLKPYSRRVKLSDLDKESQAALQWFQSQVPQRTLHNWQNSAADLVARYIFEQEGILKP